MKLANAWNLALNDAIPVKQRLYRDTSIFQEADADKVSKSPVLTVQRNLVEVYLHMVINVLVWLDEDVDDAAINTSSLMMKLRRQQFQVVRVRRKI